MTRRAPIAWIFGSSFYLTLAAASLASTGSKPDSAGVRQPSAPQVRRNDVDSTISWTPATPEARAMIKKTLARVLMATPKPSPPLAPAEEDAADDSASQTVGTKTGMIKGTQRWVPLDGKAERNYQAPTSEDEDSFSAKFLEIVVAANSTRGLSLGIASRSDKPHILEVPGAVGVEQSTVLGPDSGKTDADAGDHAHDEPIVLLRVYIVDSDLENQIRKLQKEAGGFPAFAPTQVLADHPDELRSIVVQFYGSKSDVDAAARKIDVPSLRRFLAQ